MQPEIELKLDLSPDEADPFMKSSVVGDLDTGTAMLDATYFDTSDRQLSKMGVSLRIRRSGTRLVQTVKANGGGSGGLFARDEWEMPVDSDVPVLDDRNPVAGLLGDAVGDVAPAFAVSVERRTWLVVQDGATIELVLDRGAVRAGGREEAICEIELELKSGDPADLFALARRIDADVAVRPGVLSKAERGYLLTGALPPAWKAEAVTLDKDATIGDAFGRISGQCLRHYRLNEAVLLTRYHPEALHQARVAMRRLRTALWLFKPVLQTEAVAGFQGELRWLAHVIGDARDLDVLTAQVSDAGQRAGLEAARADAHARVLQWLASARVRMLLIDLSEWQALGAVSDMAAVQPVSPFAAERLRKLRKRISRRGRHMKRLGDDARHGVRKDAKKLRYAAEYFRTLFGRKKRRKHFVRKLEVMQDILGVLNDMVTAPATMARHGLDAPAHPGGKTALLSDAARAHEDFLDARRFWR